MPAKKRLTKQQLEAQLSYAQQELLKTNSVLEAEKERLSQLISDWNSLLTVLEQIFQVHVYSEDGNTWIAECDEKKSTGHPTVAEAFEAALREQKETAQ